MNKKILTMLGVGDIILDTKPPAERLFELVTPTLKQADVVIGQGEVYYTDRGVDTFPDLMFPAAPCPLGNLSAIPSAGFNVITLASNHAWDSGAPAIEDTISGLRKYGIAFTGAGMNITQARIPAIIERDGTKFGFLAYNCTGPRGSWATADKPGCAYVHVVTAYEVDEPVIGGYPRIYTFALPQSLKAMVDDIQKLRPLCDVLVVSLHKGVGFVPTVIAMYEQQLSYAAIDAGADLILGHHAHILKGIEMYKGKAIFHGMGNFAVVVEHGLANNKSPEEKQTFMQEFKKVHGGPFFFEPEGKESQFPPKEESYTLIVKCEVTNKKITKVNFYPCMINKLSQPEIFGNDERGQKVFSYMENITRGAELNARYAWEGNEIIVYSQ